jgi:hypothetical protein
MKQYFDDIEALDRYTLELDRYPNQRPCCHCTKNDQLVSHGYVYKQRSRSLREAVGKRILCSNRYGRSGCGRTFRLYLATEIPSLQYGAAQLFVFLSALLANLSVVAAYQQATGQNEARNAWRWLHRLDRRLLDYRRFLQTRLDGMSTSFTARTRRLQILLPTIRQLYAKLPGCPCAHYQRLTQSRFI